MTSALDRLRTGLAEINVVVQRTSAASDLSGIRREIKTLRDQLNSAGAGTGATRDRVREALISFRSDGTLKGPRQARLVCAGTNLAIGEQPILIEDPQRFPRLLDQLSPLLREPRTFRRCWGGLLNGYFTYDPTRAESGQRNWEMLRRYLWETRTALSTDGFQPDWVSKIAEHANLLTEDPCSRYGPSLLAGDRQDIEVAWAKIGITDASWVNRRLVEAQISAAVALPDREFRASLPAMIELLEAHPLLSDAGLSKLLMRYAACVLIEINPMLRDFSVARWGNPWIASNDKKWSRVTPTVKVLINDWLKLDFIEKFFSLLSADQLNDARRVAFWRQYHDKIDDMRFALGDTAARNPSKDFRDLRKRMSGLTMDLYNGGSANNNAFIMHIGKHVFVEFGEKGNALYVFDGSNLPFDLTRSYIDGNSTALKHPQHVERIIHRDSDWQTWEQKVAELIERRTGIKASRANVSRRDQSANASLQPAQRPIAATLLPATGGSTSPQADSALDLYAFLKKYGLKSVDSRDKGGSLWVYADRHSGLISEWLLAHKFAWSNKRDAWYLTGGS